MASACSSECNTEKSCFSSLSIPQSRQTAISESYCSSNARCYLRRKKPVHPLAMSLRPSINSNVRQRVASAKLVKIRTLQSQLNDANFHLMELAQENRALKITQRRQDRALDTYEGVNADLPRLIKSHEEDNRILTERNRTMKRQVRELSDLLKSRDEELLVLKDQLKHLNELANDKQLKERDLLRRDLTEANALISKYESEISVLNRKVEIVTKNCRHRVNAEISKYKKCQQQNLAEEGEYQSEHKVQLMRRRFDVRKSSSNLSSSSSKDNLQADFKLEPIHHSPAPIKPLLHSPLDHPAAKDKIFNDLLDELDKKEQMLKKNKGGRFKTKTTAAKLETSKVDCFEKIELVDEKLNQLQSAIDRRNNMYKNKTKFSSTKINKQDKDTDGSQEFENEDVVNDAENSVKEHLRNLKESKAELMKVHEEVREMEEGDKRVNSNEPRIAANGMRSEDEDDMLANEIWGAEYTYRKSQTSKTAVDEANKDPLVVLESKQKLLAALKQIDNGKITNISNDNELELGLQQRSIDNENKKSRLLQELFGTGLVQN